MKNEIFQIEARNCKTYIAESPEVLLIQPVDSHDYDMLKNETTYISEHTNTPYILVAFSIDSWNTELSPWTAPPVFGKEGFGEGANDTLSFILDVLLPEIREKYNIAPTIPTILGGYSLAGLFALWSAYQTDTFNAITASSPSVWFPGFLDYAKDNNPHTKHIYLSLGDKEERAKNSTMATVGNCTRELSEIFTSKAIDTTLEWNEGNHFKEPDIRTAKGFIWCIERTTQC
ncbi:MAG: esterase [Pseudobutyrivibrio sp.]|nr:esterase [Pseudobutyrivibrio sp.]